MPANPFVATTPPPIPVPKLADVVKDIDNRKGTCARNLLATYRGIQSLIHANPNYTSAQVVAALGAEEYGAIQLFAVLVKSVVNTVVPATIQDTVPVAEIVLPKA